MSGSFKLCPTHFAQGWANKISKGDFALPGYGPDHNCPTKMAKFVYKNTLQSVANYQSQTI